MKLIRPLHRQRTRKRNRHQVLASGELASHFNVGLEQLESFLRDRKIAYHKDSRGELWASLEVEKE